MKLEFEVSIRAQISDGYPIWHYTKPTFVLADKTDFAGIGYDDIYTTYKSSIPVEGAILYVRTDYPFWNCYELRGGKMLPLPPRMIDSVSSSAVLKFNQQVKIEIFNRKCLC